MRPAIPSPRRRLLLCATLWLAAASGCARLTLPPPQLTDGLVSSSFPDAGAVVLQNVATIEFSVRWLPGVGKRLVATLDCRRRLKVLQPGGLTLADVRLPVDGYSTVTQVVARSVGPNGDQIYVAQRDVHLVPRESSKLRAPEVMDLAFHVPNVQVGGLIEYRYLRVYLDPDLLPPFVFGGDLPVVHAEFGIVTDPTVKLDYRYGHGDAIEARAPILRATEDGRERLIFIETDLPAFFVEPHMPHVSHMSPWISLALRRTQVRGRTERIDSWDDVGARIIQDMVAVGGGAQNGNVRHRLEATRAALLPWPMPTLAGRRPQAAASLFAGTPACSRDAAAVVLRALTGTDVHAAIVLLTGPEAPPVPEDFPSRGIFSGAAVALTTDVSMLAGLHCSGPPFARDPMCGVRPGERIFFDPLCTWCPFGVLPAALGGSRALLIDGEGNTSWFNLPIDPPGRHSLSLTASLTMEVDGSVGGEGTAEARGRFAGALRQALAERQHDLTGEAAIALARFVLGEADRPAISSPSVDNVGHGAATLDLPVIVRGNLKVKMATNRFNTFSIPAEQLAGSSIPSFWRGARNAAAVVEGPWWKEAVVHVALPPGFNITLPPSTKLVTPHADYAAGFALRGTQLTYSRRLVLKRAIIPAAEWSDFHAFFEAVRQAEAASVRMEIQP